MRQIKFLCKTCNKSFISKKACKNRQPKFCSKYCYGQSIAHFKKCAFCGKIFYNYLNKFFCSMDCSGKSKIGIPLSEAHRKACSEARKGRFQFENHPEWKGDKVGYGALHEWVHRKLGSPNVCAKCGKSSPSNRKIHWANKSGLYKRDIKDWIRLCVSCHKLYDLNKMGNPKKENFIPYPVRRQSTPDDKETSRRPRKIYQEI